MKTPEDEAFDDLAKKQGAWGGGFKAKRAMAADKLWDKPSVAFDEWWNGDNDESTNPFQLESFAYWAWAGWKAALAQPAQEPVKLWLWKNFVDGKPEYWAFDNAFPIFMDSHDPQTLGEPCGYAWLKPSRAGRPNVRDEQVLQDVQEALAQPAQEPVACARCKDLEEQAYDLLGQLKAANLKWSVAHPWVGLTDEEIRDCLGPEAVCIPPGWSRLTRAIEAKLKQKNNG